MCWYAYIATSKPLKNVVFSKDLLDNNVMPPPLHFREVTDPEDSSNKYRPLFKGQYLYYVGTETGCGCGLERGSTLTTYPDGKTEIEYNNNPSHLAFIAFVKNYTLKEPLEMYTVWESDFQEEPLDRIDINAAEIQINNYALPVSRQFYTFYTA